MIDSIPAKKGDLIELNSRAFFRLSGTDAIRFLNGQITQDVKKATQSQAVYTCITNAKGKLEGDAWIRKENDSILLDCPLSLRETLFQRLDRYIIADDVLLEDVTDDYQLYHYLEAEPNEEISKKNHWSANRYGLPGIDFFSKETLKALPEISTEKLRILAAIPAWGKELDETILPPEAKLENRAISYNKGCYIGQEVISRMKSAGKFRKSLATFKVSKTIPIPYDLQHSKKFKPTGTITSLCKTSDEIIGLGYLSYHTRCVVVFNSGDLNIQIKRIK